ncbi:hypothetical protein CHISP_0839 [Chitinispirillum alkaliphilum]|nr:hypothetical protein CHISP_0839 [Chitinispirillum alkaliphilum]
MNSSKTRFRKYFLIALVLLFVGIINSCGGGFGTDSHNSEEFSEPIFGTDTLRFHY